MNFGNRHLRETVIPAKAGIQGRLAKTTRLDSRLRGNDEQDGFRTCLIKPLTPPKGTQQ